MCLALRRFLFALAMLGAFLPSISSATLYPAPTSGWYGYSGFNTSLPALCVADIPYQKNAVGGNNWAYDHVQGNTCWWTYTNSFGNSSTSYRTYNTGTQNLCPSNSTASGSTCTCNSGYDEVGGACQEHVDVCGPTAGTLNTLNHTVGWTLSPDIDADGNAKMVGTANMPPATSCSAGCQWEHVSDNTAWQSAEPTANGLYRLSIDSTYRQTATPCSTPTPAANPQDTPPSCPGYVGQVNGKTVCVGTASAPVSTTTVKPPGTGIGSANPTAGVIPSSGEGSGVTGPGRTPTNGDGSNAGGPAAASSGTTIVKSGQTASPDPGLEQQNCGAPGQPVCAVRSDEAGTPSGSGYASQNGNSGLDAAMDAAISQIDGITQSDGKDTSWTMPAWFNAEACTPWQIAHFPAPLDLDITLDICPVKPYIDGAANFIWLVMTFFGTLSMVFRVTTKSED